MNQVVLDFESYYDDSVSVVKQGTPNYVKSADAYCVSVVGDNIEPMCGTLEEMRPIIDQLSKDPTVQPIALNANFDRAWEEKYWQPFQNDWHCISDQAVASQLPRNLAQMAGVVLGEKLDKTTRDEMKGVRYEDLSPEEQTKVLEYCLNDSIKEYEILKKLPPMSSVEAAIASHTRMINRRGVRINTELVEQDKTKLEAMRFEAFKGIPWHADAPPLSYQALVRFCNAKGLPVPKSLAKTDEEVTDLMTDSPELKTVIDTMRRFRRANTMIKKVESLMERVTDAGVLPMDLLYCGAPHTRRWSSKGFNVQNLDKEPLIISPEIGSVWTRSWIVPRPGHKFLILDFAQIEPRCLNWLAGNEEMMQALSAGFSYYEAYLIGSGQASRVGWSGKSGTLKKELDKAKYTRVKNEALGCLAEGTLVLTEKRGYQRIEDISKEDRIWDGLTWVEHSGILDKGYSSVCSVGQEYYTTDHEIYTSELSKKQAGAIQSQEQAQAMAWRQAPDSDWSDVWKLARSVARITTQEGLSCCKVLLRKMWPEAPRLF